MAALTAIFTAGAASLSAAAGLAGTGFQIAQGIDQANQAKAQRRKEAAIQNKALTREEATERRTKQKKKAADFQKEREASLGTSEQGTLGGQRQASILGGSPSGVGRAILGG